MTLNLLQPTTAEIDAYERILHEALSDNGVSEPDSYYRCLAESLAEAGLEVRWRAFVAECEPDVRVGRLRAVPDPLSREERLEAAWDTRR